MKILVTGKEELKQLLPIPDCIDAMERMFRSLSTKDTAMAERTIIPLSGSRGNLVIMPASESDIATAKVMTIFSDNSRTPFESIQGAVLIFDVLNGRLLGVVDSTTLTALRTAAVSALATKLLARVGSSSLAVLGSGAQGAAHLQAMSLVRNISKVRIWSRTLARAQRLASTVRNSDAEAVDSAREAVKDADIVCTTTSSPVPILRRDWLREGCHINAIGAYSATTRELDTSIVKDCRLFVDSRVAARKEAGDFLIPRNEGAISDGHIVGELHEVVTGKVRGRTSDGEITLFKSVGLAVEDAAACRLLYQRASQGSESTWIEFGSEREIRQ